MIKIRSVSLAITLLLLLIPSTASATLVCDWSTITEVVQYPESGWIGARVNLPTGSKILLLCTTEPSSGSISGADCDDVLSTLYFAVSRGALVKLRFHDGAPASGGGGAATCSQLAEWHTGLANYFYLMQTK